MTAAEIYLGYFTHYWVAETGLGRLDRFPLDSITLSDGTESVSNENGILFLTVFLICCELAGLNIKPYGESYAKTVRSLEREPGLFCRQPGNFVRYEAQDNPAAICVGSVIFNLPFSRERAAFGSRHGNNFNNVDPETWKLEQQQQPGETAFTATCAGYAPAMLDWFAMLAGFLVNAFQSIDHEAAASNCQLAWVRLYGLRKCKFATTWQNLSFYPVLWFWQFKFYGKYKNLSGLFKRYYGSLDHPIHAMAELIDGT